MRFLLISVGSRGDSEPFCSLAQALLAKSHQVDLFLMTDSMKLAPDVDSNLLKVHELPFTQMDFYTYATVAPKHGATHENPRVRFVGIVTDIIAALVLPCREQIIDVASSCDMIVTSSLARPLSMAVAQKCDIPTCIIHLQALLPTDKFPHSSHTKECVAAILKPELLSDPSHLESYIELDRVHHEFLQDRLDEMYKKLELPPLRYDEKFQKSMLGQDGGKTLIANAFSDELIPSVTQDADSTVYDIGALADTYISSSPFTPPADLVTFLDDTCDGTPPICIGYGSMPFSKASMILEALQELDVKAILVGDALKVDETTTNNVFHISSIPYPWLLPRCSMMLCHGGAGVVHATLRAGIPCVISPLMGDQFFWADLLQAKNVGVRAGANMGALTKEEVVDGIQQAQAANVVTAAKEMGGRIRAKETGVDHLVRVLEQHFEAQN